MDLSQTEHLWPLLLAALVAFAESAVGVGVFFPGEVALTALASTLEGPERVVAVIVIALGATVGDHTGYLVGRQLGGRLSGSRLVRRLGPDRWAAATLLIERHGGLAVFVSRLVPVARTVMPPVAGVAGLPYVRFATASVAGSILWATLWVSTGSVLSTLDLPTSPAALAVLVGLGGVIAWAAVALRRRTARARSPRGR